MSRGPAIVFLGPSLSREEAEAALPGVLVLPPAGMGDVIAAAHRYRPHSIGVVDGYFLSQMSVFHKELVYVLAQGVWTLGASSMGALRAAECDAFGMIGVGTIYQALASGELEDDDEVALTHADASAGFRPLSDAMVTVRATLDAARRAGLVSEEEHDLLVGRQKARWFPDRRLSTVASDAVDLGMPPARGRELGLWLRDHVVDPKREDALALLGRMAELPPGPIPEAERPELVVSRVFEAMLARDRKVATGQGWEVSFDRIRRYAALHADDYDEVMQAARLDRAIATLSLMVGGPASDDEALAARHAVADLMGVEEADLDDHLASLDMDGLSVRKMLATEAHRTRLATSWLGRTTQGLITGDFINQLRLRGRYADLRQEAGLEQAAGEGVVFEPPPTPTEIVRTFVAVSGWTLPDDLRDYISTEELGTVMELLSSMTYTLRCQHALLGTEILGDEPGRARGHVLGVNEPIMSRGR